MPIKAIIADDEAPGRETLQLKLANYFPEVEIVAICATVKDTIQQIEQLRPDLVFLDVQFSPENTTGFQVLETLQTIHFEVVFVSGYQEFALEAFRQGALHFVLKPIDVSDLREAIERVKLRLATRKQNSRVVIPLGRNHIRIVPVDKIIYCRGAHNYTEIVIEGQRKIMGRLFLKDIIQILPTDRFFQIQRSYIVNLCHVVEYQARVRGSVILSTGEEFGVSQEKRDELYIRLNSPMPFCD